MKKKKHGCLVVILVIVVIFAAMIIWNELSNKMEEKKRQDTENSKVLEWPDSDVGKMIPKPKSKNGEVVWEREDGFDLDVCKVSKSDYNEYVKACKKSGFTKDYNKTDTMYEAYNSNGYHLDLIYFEDDEYMTICLERKKKETTSTTETTTATTTAKKKEVKTSGIRPRVKKAIDSYEKVMDSYCKFMKKYNESDDTSSMVKEYANYMDKYSDAVDKFEKIKDDDLNDAELRYYTKVQVRVTKKLADVQ